MKHVVDAPKPHDIDDTCNKVFGDCSKCPYEGMCGDSDSDSVEA